MEWILRYIFIFAENMKLESKPLVFLAVFCVFYLLLFSSSCVKETGRLPRPLSQQYCDTTDTRYSTVIKPMMQTHCATVNCHDGSGGAPLDLNKYDDLKLFYDFGTLKSRVVDLKDMPPSAPLPDSLIQKLQCWIGKGAQNN